MFFKSYVWLVSIRIFSQDYVKHMKSNNKEWTPSSIGVQEPGQSEGQIILISALINCISGSLLCFVRKISVLLSILLNCLLIGKHVIWHNEKFLSSVSMSNERPERILCRCLASQNYCSRAYYHCNICKSYYVFLTIVAWQELSSATSIRRTCLWYCLIEQVSVCKMMACFCQIGLENLLHLIMRLLWSLSRLIKVEGLCPQPACTGNESSAHPLKSATKSYCIWVQVQRY